MAPFKKITIIGVGLIGGSIGLAVKKRGLAREVTGVFRRRSTRAKALAHKAVDRGVFDLAEGVKGADLVVLAANVGTIPALAQRCIPHLGPGSILTDVGSVKGPLVAAIERSIGGRGVHFAGSHPMAGSEMTGVEHADADLFDGALTIVTRTRRTGTKAVRLVSRFWRSLGSRVRVMSPEEHDRRIAMVSHLPHLAAVALCTAQKSGDLALAAGGFRDTTRIAASDPRMWLDIVKDNRHHVMRALAALSAELDRAGKLLSRKDFKALGALLKRANRIRGHG